MRHLLKRPEQKTRLAEIVHHPRHEEVKESNTPRTVVQKPHPAEIHGFDEARSQAMTRDLTPIGVVIDHDSEVRQRLEKIEEHLGNIAGHAEASANRLTWQASIRSDKTDTVIFRRRGVIKVLHNPTANDAIVTLVDGTGGIPYVLYVSSYSVTGTLHLPFQNGLRVVSCYTAASFNTAAPVNLPGSGLIAFGEYDG